ncbi:hypothetical protein ACH5RR_023843 [Cinchona calisaya]|uniref:Uncharacterized protein n=1 Tax=Cinchona calisaya TaxID=153742 RepID=A0ABD2ZDN6_9GENT
MEKNSPVIRLPDHEICREKRSAGGIHNFHRRFRMKKKLRLLLVRRRWNNINWRGVTGDQSSNTRTSDGALIQQQRKWTPPCHTIFKCLIPSLLAVVAVKYQAISEDPSRTRPLHTWSFLISIFLYSLILFAAKPSQKHFDNYLKSLGRVALASGVVSSLSLISLLLPSFPGLLLLCTSWALFILLSAFSIVQYCTYNSLFVGIKTPFHIAICSARNLFTGWSFSQQPPSKGTRPPV